MNNASSSSLTTTLVHILRSTWSLPWARCAALLVSGVVLPLRVLWTPVLYAFRVLRAVFAPVGHVLDCAAGWVGGVAGFLISLEPLYAFFTTAALIGILAGILTALLSSLVTTTLNMYDTPPDDNDDHHRALSRQRPQNQVLEEQPLSGGDQPPQKKKKQQQQHEQDWPWADPSALVSASSPGGARSRRISSLQAETIHEEEDDDDDDADADDSGR